MFILCYTELIPINNYSRIIASGGVFIFYCLISNTCCQEFLPPFWLVAVLTIDRWRQVDLSYDSRGQQVSCSRCRESEIRWQKPTLHILNFKNTSWNESKTTHFKRRRVTIKREDSVSKLWPPHSKHSATHNVTVSQTWQCLDKQEQIIKYS